jgi:hypothetical protein
MVEDPIGVRIMWLPCRAKKRDLPSPAGGSWRIFGQMQQIVLVNNKF